MNNNLNLIHEATVSEILNELNEVEIDITEKEIESSLLADELNELLDNDVN